MMILNLYIAGARDRQRESIHRFQRLEEAASNKYETRTRVYAGSTRNRSIGISVMSS